jgi:CheY-like chemotaxis protein
MQKQMPVMDGSPAQPTLGSARRHILFVDDDGTFGEAMAQVLRRAGFDVTFACDFRLALEVLEADCQIDMLICDIVMPNSVNGIALTRMARLRRRDLKVMYITGHNIPGVEKEALGPILRKPVDEARLVSEVERALATV